MAFGLLLPIRIVQFILAVVVVGLSGYASHPYAHLLFSVLNALFYFAGFIALSVFLGKLLFCRGSVCSAARADAVFAAFSWIAWTFTAGLTAMELFKGGFSLKSLSLRGAKEAKVDAAAKSAMKEERPVGLGA